MGLSEWWKRISGSANDDAAKTGLSEPSEASYDEHQSQKADQYVDQRDPGVTGMVDDEFKRGP